MQRFWQIDFARGTALILMLLFNWSFTLAYLDVFVITDGDLYWFWFPRLIGAMFVFIAGLSFSISYSRIKKNEKAYRKFLRRGLKVFSLGLLITLVTYMLVPEGAIYFGILHLIGLSVILAIAFRNLGRANLALGLAFILAGIYVHNVTLETPWLLWLGLKPGVFYTFDYFPLMPWFGVFLIGMYYGNKVKLKQKAQPAFSKLATFLGRHTLAVYLLHQPVLFAALLLLGYNIL